LTQRIRSDSPPTTPSISSPSYSPVHSLKKPSRPASSANSTTSSVEFIDEISIPPPRLRFYYYYDPHQSLDTLITQFPQCIDPFLRFLYDQTRWFRFNRNQTCCRGPRP